MRLGLVDHGARSPEQRSRIGSQHDQGSRGRARQPSSRLWAWQWKAIDVSSVMLRGGNELCKSWPHMLGSTLIDTHSFTLTGVTHFVLCDTFHPFLDSRSYCDGQYHFMRIHGRVKRRLSIAKDRSIFTRNHHVSPRLPTSPSYVLSLLTSHLTNQHTHSECGPHSRIRAAGSRRPFSRYRRLWRSLVHLWHIPAPWSQRG